MKKLNSVIIKLNDKINEHLNNSAILIGGPIITQGKEAVVQFLADKTGTFQYYCSVGKHRSMGMWGTIIVQ